MAQLKIDVRDTDRKVSGKKGIEVDDEVYDKLSKSAQTLIVLFEKYVGDNPTVIEYSNGYGISDDTLSQIIEKFKLG
jgi:hypothetical protein